MEVRIQRSAKTAARRRGSTLIVGAREDACLAYANTLSWRGSAAPAEAVSDFAALLAWCRGTKALSAKAAGQLEAWSRAHRSRAAAAHAEAIALREALYRLFSALAEGHAIAERDFAALRRAVERAPARRRLARADGGYAWQIEIEAIEEAGLSAPALLAPVLWSAADLLAGSGQRRIRRCANAECLWLFLDASKSGTRRWCDMASCGNRAKAKRHYLKTRQD